MLSTDRTGASTVARERERESGSGLQNKVVVLRLKNAYQAFSKLPSNWLALQLMFSLDNVSYLSGKMNAYTGDQRHTYLPLVSTTKPEVGERPSKFSAAILTLYVTEASRPDIVTFPRSLLV